MTTQTLGQRLAARRAEQDRIAEGNRRRQEERQRSQRARASQLKRSTSRSRVQLSAKAQEAIRKNTARLQASLPPELARTRGRVTTVRQQPKRESASARRSRLRREDREDERETLRQEALSRTTGTKPTSSRVRAVTPAPKPPATATARRTPLTATQRRSIAEQERREERVEARDPTARAITPSPAPRPAVQAPGEREKARRDDQARDRREELLSIQRQQQLAARPPTARNKEEGEQQLTKAGLRISGNTLDLNEAIRQNIRPSTLRILGFNERAVDAARTQVRAEQQAEDDLRAANVRIGKGGALNVVQALERGITPKTLETFGLASSAVREAGIQLKESKDVERSLASKGVVLVGGRTDLVAAVNKGATDKELEAVGFSKRDIASANTASARRKDAERELREKNVRIKEGQLDLRLAVERGVSRKSLTELGFKLSDVDIAKRSVDALRVLKEKGFSKQGRVDLLGAIADGSVSTAALEGLGFTKAEIADAQKSVQVKQLIATEFTSADGEVNLAGVFGASIPNKTTAQLKADLRLYHLSNR